MLTRRKVLIGVIAAPAIIRPAKAWIHGNPGSGYNNLANWPSVTNRPTLSGSVLSWIGPVGGGASTSSDTAQTQTLTGSGGAIATGSNNQVIQNLDINTPTNVGFNVGVLSINNTGVTVKKCRIRNNTGAGANSGSPVIALNVAAANLLFEDCIIDGGSTGGSYTGAQNGVNFNGGDGVTFRRCNILGCENHLRTTNNTTVIDCWFHSTIGSDADMFEQDAGSANNLIQHNSFDGTDTQAGAFLNSGCNFTNQGPGGSQGTQPISGQQIINCAFINLPNFGICDDDSKGSTTVNWSITNSGFFNVSQPRRSASTGFTHGGSGVSPNSGNFNMANAAATSGTPVNGTGSV